MPMFWDQRQDYTEADLKRDISLIMEIYIQIASLNFESKEKAQSVRNAV